LLRDCAHGGSEPGDRQCVPIEVRKSDKPCSPVIDEGPYGYQQINVAKQRRDPNSMLNWTERLAK